MAEKLLEPEPLPALVQVSHSEPEPMVVAVHKPLCDVTIECSAVRIGRFVVVKLPDNFLDSPASSDPLSLPLPSSASDASGENSDSSTDPPSPSIQLFPLFKPNFSPKNPPSRSKRVCFKKKSKKVQAQMDRPRSFSSSNVKKQAHINAYFARDGSGPMRAKLERDPAV